MIYTDFRLRPIGQGAFYTGLIDYKGHSFNMVFDCGSLSNLEQLKSEIHYFKWNKRHFYPDKLDVLFISHLDDDHVNGLRELLTNFSCDKIYLPYLTPIQRLYLALQHSPKNTPDYDDYLLFLSNPHNYLNNIEGAQINAINYITGNSKFMTESGPQEKKPTNSDINEIIVTEQLDASQEEDGNLEGVLPTNVFFKLANNTILVNNFWEFFLYHKPATDLVLSDLYQNIKDTFGIKVDGILKQEDLAKILNKKEGLKELRLLYKKHFKSLNKTGLVVMHKPLNYQRANFTEHHYTQYIPYNFNFYQPSVSQVHSVSHDNKIYQWGVSLLTGDICMNQIKDSNYIANHLKDVMVFQVPHHGSAFGWEGSYLHDFSNYNETIFMINFGYGNKYGHPNPNVLSNLFHEGKIVRFCNQFEGCQYRINLELT